jgi:uncharacterized membrane protein YtjA (UPF0391 family)
VQPSAAHSLHHSVVNLTKESTMFFWALTFFLIAIVAGLFGFFGLAAGAAGIAKIIFVVAIVMAIISFVAGRRPPV